MYKLLIFLLVMSCGEPLSQSITKGLKYNKARVTCQKAENLRINGLVSPQNLQHKVNIEKIRKEICQYSQAQITCRPSGAMIAQWFRSKVDKCISALLISE